MTKYNVLHVRPDLFQVIFGPLKPDQVSRGPAFLHKKSNSLRSSTVHTLYLQGKASVEHCKGLDNNSLCHTCKALDKLQKAKQNGINLIIR